MATGIFPRQYFCCGSSMLHAVMSWSPAIWSLDLQLPIMLPVLFCFVILNRKSVNIDVATVFNYGS